MMELGRSKSIRASVKTCAEIACQCKGTPCRVKGHRWETLGFLLGAISGVVTTAL